MTTPKLVSRSEEIVTHTLEIWPESGVSRPATILGVNKRSEG